MPFNDPDSLSNANRRLAIVGVFSDSNTKKFVFRRNPSAGAHRLSPAEFFDKVAPELRFSGGQTVTIGKTIFNKTKIEAPKIDADGKFQGHGVSIPVDSPLLDVAPVENTSEYQMMQQRGGNLFRSLLEDLDALQQFDQGSFSASILKFARWYMYKYASEQAGDFEISWSDWEDMGFDHDLASKVLHLMTCCPSDEVEAESRVKRSLNAHAGDAGMNPQVIDALSEGLRRCRRVAESEAADDRLVGKAVAEGYAFIKDFPGSERGFHLPGVGGKGLLQYYTYFRKKSDRVHSFVRNGALHSYLFMWLAGKYSKFRGQDDARSVASKMFELSIEGQGDKRIPGMTKEERLRAFQIIRATDSELQGADKKRLESLETYEKFAEALNREIMKNLQPPREFRREVLAERNQGLFIMLSQMAGGKAGAIFQDASKQCLALVKVYRGAKNVHAADGQKLTKTHFLDLFEKLKGEENAALMEKLAAKVQTIQSEDEQLKAEVCELVVSGIAGQTKTFFDSTMLENIDAIEKEIEELREIYQLHMGVTINSSSQSASEGASGLGMAGAIITNVEVGLPVEESSAGDLKIYQESLAKVASSMGLSSSQALPSETVIGVPNSLETAVAKGGPGEIKDAKGKVLATVAREEDGNLRIELSDNADREQLLASDTTISFGDTSVTVVDAEIKLDHLVRGPDSLDAAKAVKNFGAYSDCKRRIRGKYMSEGESDSMFRQSTRALALGEYMLAAPKNLINLGIADLSNVLGVILDATEHIGCIDAKTLEAGAELDPDKLTRLNLSLHYPVNNKKELQEIVQYHANQCRSLEALVPYLRELSDIRALLQASAGTDAEIVVLNTTLGAQAEEARHPFYIEDRPGVCYLTHQSQPTAAGIRELSEAMVAEAQRNKDYPVVPIVITPAELKQDGAAFPLIGPATFKLPQLLAADAPSEGGLPITGQVVSPYLAMAMSLMGGLYRDSLGKITGLTRKTDKSIADTLKLGPEGLSLVHNDRYLTDLFLDVWAWTEGPLLGELILVKWLNLCLAYRTDAEADKKFLGQSSYEPLHWLRKDCRPALHWAYDNGAKVAKQAFAGFKSDSIADFSILRPLDIPTSNQLGNCAKPVPFDAGALGVSEIRKGRHGKGFGKVAFVSTWSRIFAGAGSDTNAEETV